MASGAAPATIGQLAPAWELTDLTGKLVRSTDLRGQVVLLNIFRTTCTPCSWEIPDLISLQEQYGTQGLVVIGVGAQQTADVLRSYANDLKINYPICSSTDDMLWDYNVFPLGAIPLTTVIDRSGKVVDWYRYYQSRSFHEDIIRPLLAPALPQLSLQRAAAGLELSWPTNMIPLIIETAPGWDNATAPWQQLTNTVVTSNGVHRVRLSNAQRAGFFRLREP